MSVVLHDRQWIPATVLLAASLALALFASVSADAQELEPRAYRTLPTGLNFALVDLQILRGNVLADPTSPLQDLDVDVLVTTFGYLRSFGLLGRSASVSVAVPWAVMSGSATFQGEPVSDTRSGAADLRVRLAVNLIGGPALSPREFAAYRQGRNVGVSLTVTAPTGQYDRNRLVNFGNNRWGVKPEIGYSSIRGRWIFEAAAGVWLFTDNTQFAGDHTRSQKPIGSFQAHVSYNFPGGARVGLGRTTSPAAGPRSTAWARRTCSATRGSARPCLCPSGADSPSRCRPTPAPTRTPARTSTSWDSRTRSGGRRPHASRLCGRVGRSARRTSRCGGAHG